MNAQEYDVLLVEDDEADLELTLHALARENLGARVQVARDGAEALAILLPDEDADVPENPKLPKVVLLDLKLPKVDGLSVLHKIKDDARTKNLPVVILTSSKEEKDLLKGYRLGANSYIQKPVNFQKFRDVIRQLGLYWLNINEPGPKPRSHSGE